MPKSKMQFQKGLSLSDFLGKYGTGTQCREALFKLRRPDGFVCPKCGNEGHCKLSTRNLYQSNRCHHQTSITAGTIFHRTRLPLTKWFLASYSYLSDPAQEGHLRVATVPGNRCQP